MTVKANQQSLVRQIVLQFQGKRHIPATAADHEISHGRDIVEMTATGTREGKPFHARHLCYFSKRTSRCDNSLRTSREALLQLVSERWRLETWHWIRDTLLREDAHRYQGNGTGAIASLRTAALNLLRLAGFESIRSGMQQ